jgi:hypothetical protein
MDTAPRLASVAPLEETQLLVRFANGVEKVYDCRRVLDLPQFGLLRDPAFFRSVKVDPGGYGISWNDDIDLSEYELWVNGKPISEAVG